VLERELGRVQVPVRVLELAPVSALGLVPAREQGQVQAPVLASVHSQRRLTLILVPQPQLDLKLVSSFSPPK